MTEVGSGVVGVAEQCVFHGALLAAASGSEQSGRKNSCTEIPALTECAMGMLSVALFLTSVTNAD